MAVIEFEKVTEPGPPAPFGVLFSYLAQRFKSELGLALCKNDWARAKEIIKKIASEAESLRSSGMKTTLDRRTIVTQLRGAAEANPNTRDLLIVFLRGIPHFEDAWLAASSIQALDEIIRRAGEAAARRAGAPNTPNQVGEGGVTTTYEFTVPAVKSDVLSSLRAELCGHHVSYRFAFESGTEDIVAREVVTFSPAHDKIVFETSFIFSHYDEGNERIFAGNALPLGQSLMCIGFYGDAANGGRDSNKDRGRSLFFHGGEFEGVRNARLGILSTTRAQLLFEPCAACVLLFKVVAPIAHDRLSEFRRRVTVIRPLQQILETDFSSLNDSGRKLIQNFLDNRPSEDGGRDRVLKLLPARFPQIGEHITRLYDKNDAKAPFTARWEEGLLADIN